MKSITKEHIREIWQNTSNDFYSSLYIDIPFCEKYCNYCIYKKNNYSKKNIELYFSHLEEEMKFFSSSFLNKKISVIHIGGGSPSILSKEQIIKLKNIINSNYSIEFTPDGTRTIELNPFDLHEDVMLEILSDDNFFNRISFGIQSFSKEIIESHNRTYYSKNRFIELIEYIRHVRPNININVDLMIGLAKDEIKSFFQSIDILNKLNINKITISENSNIPKSENLENYFQFIKNNLKKIYSHKYRFVVNSEFEEKDEDIRNIIFMYNKENKHRYKYIYGEVFSISNIISFGPSSKSFIKESNITYTRDNILDFKDSTYTYNTVDCVEDNITLNEKMFKNKEKYIF